MTASWGFSSALLSIRFHDMYTMLSRCGYASEAVTNLAQFHLSLPSEVTSRRRTAHDFLRLEHAACTRRCWMAVSRFAQSACCELLIGPKSNYVVKTPGRMVAVGAESIAPSYHNWRRRAFLNRKPLEIASKHLQTRPQPAWPLPSVAVIFGPCRFLPTNASHLGPPISSRALRCSTSFCAACLSIVLGGA